MELLAHVPLRYDNDAPDWNQVAAALNHGKSQRSLRHSSRYANLGVFTGYRVALDLGSGNIGWTILFEQQRQVYFLTVDDIVAHNAALAPGAPRMQLPDLPNFVPAGVYKFDQRDQNDQKSYSKKRAEAHSKERLLDARQRRKTALRRVLVDAGLYPAGGGAPEGHRGIKANRLRVRLLDLSFPAHRHDLGRALYNLLKRRGYLKPVGRLGKDEESDFGATATKRYRETLKHFGCSTIGEFLERCARDAKRDGERFRRRHRSLAWQKANRRRDQKLGDVVTSYQAFEFLTPTFELVWAEAENLRTRHQQHVCIDERTWASIKAAAEFRRGLRGRIPGPCRWLPNELRCVRALPSFQRFRIFEQVSNLRTADDVRLDPASAVFSDAVAELERRNTITVGRLSQVLRISLKPDRDDDGQPSKRPLVGARTDQKLKEVLGEQWSGLSPAEKDAWTMRFLRRHSPPSGPLTREQLAEALQWCSEYEEALWRDAEGQFGPGALERVDKEARQTLEDKFASISRRAAQVLACAYERGLTHEQRMQALRDAGAQDPKLLIYDELPYYGEVMRDLAVPGTDFAPEDRLCTEERKFGRAANPDLHVILNRVRTVINEIIKMMGGILPSRCIVEMARSALSDEEAAEHAERTRKRKEWRDAIVDQINSIFDQLGKSRPRGPALDRLVDRWKAAERQGWRDYDGSEICESALLDGDEYQLDHVSPAAFGPFRENNLFVTRYNQLKGRRLPWKAFEGDKRFEPALAAFGTFGWQQRIKSLEGVLHPRSNLPGARGRRKLAERDRKRLEDRLADAKEQLKKLAAYSPRLDVLAALGRPPRTAPKTDAAEGETGADQPRRRSSVRVFTASAQAALFCRFHPDAAVPEGGLAARDAANIGWGTKIVLRYLRHIGAEGDTAKPWQVHAMRCMFGIEKCRDDLRNHAVDAFVIGHFDQWVLRPAFDYLARDRNFPFEEMYQTRVLAVALGHAEGGGFLGDFRTSLARLTRELPFIGTVHRPDNQWNPGDRAGGTFGAFGGENIYTFRPAKTDCERLTAVLRRANRAPPDGRWMTPAELREFLLARPDDKDEAAKKLWDEFRHAAEVRYKPKDSKPTIINAEIAEPLRAQPGAFVNTKNKFLVAAATDREKRRIVPVSEFSQMSMGERAVLFEPGRAVYRSGDIICEQAQAYVVTGIRRDGRIDAYPVDYALRDDAQLRRPTIWADARRPLPAKLKCDVLGRRLHRLRKTPGGLQPVPYPLRGE